MYTLSAEISSPSSSDSYLSRLKAASSVCACVDLFKERRSFNVSDPRSSVHEGLRLEMIPLDFNVFSSGFEAFSALSFRFAIVCLIEARISCSLLFLVIAGVRNTLTSISRTANKLQFDSPR